MKDEMALAEATMTKHLPQFRLKVFGWLFVRPILARSIRASTAFIVCDRQIVTRIVDSFFWSSSFLSAYFICAEIARLNILRQCCLNHPHSIKTRSPSHQYCRQPYRNFYWYKNHADLGCWRRWWGQSLYDC